MKYISLIEKEITQVLTAPSEHELTLFTALNDLLNFKNSLENNTPVSKENINTIQTQKELFSKSEFNLIVKKNILIDLLTETLRRIDAIKDDNSSLLSDSVTEVINFIDTGYIPTQKKIKDYFFKTLNWRIQQAILCGEYYDPMITSKLQTIESIIYIYNPQIEFKQLDEDEIEKIKSTIMFGYENYISQFQLLAKFVSENTEKLSLGKSAIDTNVSRFQNYEVKNQVKQLLKKYSEEDDELLVLEINLFLAYTDENLQCDDVLLSRLKNIIEFLKLYTRNIKSGPIIKILTDKAEFLKYKIQFRYYRAAIKQELTQNTIPIPSLHHTNVFKQFQNQIENHYLSCKYDYTTLKHQVDEMITKDISEFKLEVFHHLNKYLKGTHIDLKKRTAETDEISKILKKSQEKAIVSSEKVALKTMEQLITNNKLATEFLHEEQQNFKESIASFIKDFKEDSTSTQKGFIELKLDEVENLQSKNTLPNYYCYIKFIEFLDELINRLIKNPSLLMTEELFEEFHGKERVLTERIELTIKKLKGYYKTAIEALKNRFAIVGTHFIKPLYLMLPECRLDYNFIDTINASEEENPLSEKTENKKQADEDLDTMGLFLNSSYILPNDLKKIGVQIERWEMFLTPQLNHLKDSLDIAVGKHTIEANIDDFDKKVKESEFKAVQILAMFVSIAIFALGSVTIFNGKSGIESLGIICGLCACFVSFNLFFYLITIFQLASPKRRKQLIHRFYVFLLIPVFFGAGSFFILNGQNLSLPEKIRNQNDSLSAKYNSRLDSLRTSISNLNVLTDTLYVKMDSLFGDIQEDKKIIQSNVRKLNSLSKNGIIDSSKFNPAIIPK